MYFFRRIIFPAIICSLALLSSKTGASGCSFKPSFSGDTMICSGTTVNYTTTSVLGHYYRWVVQGGSISSGQGTNSVYVLWAKPVTGLIRLVDSTLLCKDSLAYKVKVELSAATLAAGTYQAVGTYSSVSGKTNTVTINSSGSQAGAVWNNFQISLNKNFDFNFITNQSNTSSNPNADGMMFIIQNTGTSAKGANSGGSNLGYYDAVTGVMDQSVGLELDIYTSTTYGDSSASHLSLVRNKSFTPLRKQVDISPILCNGKDRKLRITWNRDINLMEIYFDGVKAFSWNNDIVKSVFKGNPNAWFGFTGGTGLYTSLQTFANDTLKYGFPVITALKDTICSGDSTTLTATAGISYLWSTGATTRSIRVGKAGSFTVTVTDSFKCSQTSPSKSIVLITRPTASFTVSNLCANSFLSLTNGSSPTTGVTWLWKFGNGDSSTSSLPLYKYSTPGTYTMSLSVTNSGCTAKTSNSVTAYDIPSGITISKSGPFQGVLNNGDAITPDFICVADTNTYQFSSPKGISNSDYGTKWKIASISFKTNKGTSFTDTTLKYPTSTKNGYFRIFPSKKFSDSVIVVTMHIQRIPGNCDTLITRYIQVRPKVVSNFGFVNACQGFALSFMDSSKAAGLSPVSQWAWDFGDGATSTLQNPKHTYASANSYKVTLKAAADAGCSIPITKTVTQYPNPVTKEIIVPACQAYPTSFMDSSKIASGNSIASRKWYFGDGATSTSATATHSYVKSGYYNVKLVTVSSFGCKDSSTQKIRVYPKPTAFFAFNNSCIGTTVYFANTSSDSTTGTTYFWNFGDNTTSSSATASHIYKINGTYKVKLTVTSKYGCQDTMVQPLTPYPAPEFKMFHGPTCTGQGVTIIDSGQNASGSIYTWDFGDKATYVAKSNTVTHTYKASGSYTLKLQIDAPSGCSDSIKIPITVTDMPKPGFNAPNVCIGQATSFTNTSSPTAGMSWKWNFGDGSAANTSQNPKYTYKKAGSYTVKLSATTSGGCADSSTGITVVNPLPVVGKWTSAIHNYTVKFTPQDTTYAGYKWHFGTGDSSSLKMPSYTYPSTPKKYQVRLTVTTSGGCSGSLSDSLTLDGTGINPVIQAANHINIYPNPFSDQVTIHYELTNRNQVNISVYDMNGKQIAKLKDGAFEAGTYNDILDNQKVNMPDGVYFLKISINEQVYTSKVIRMY
jgi:PKD repeat protein